MNLLRDEWLPVIKQDGSRDTISIKQITQAYEENPIVELDAPRPDFRNGLYQLLIGIFQVAVAPEDEDEWDFLFYEPYNEESIEHKLIQYEDSFEIDSDGPSFMQDYDLLEDQEVENLRNLFVDLPSNEHFNKRIPQEIDAHWGAVLLYSLQTFGPAGGRGQRTGIRGGGPVTTIVIPGDLHERSTSLWEKIWSNIFPTESVDSFTGNPKKKEKSDIFPWMKPTVVSDKTGKYVYPQECNPLVMYFAMPRRIRLLFEYRAGICGITGKKTNAVVTGYRTYHSGNAYQGHWRHPLNAYRYQNDRQAPPISIKGSPAGFSYRDWMLLSFDYEGKDSITPSNVQHAQNSDYRKEIIKERGSLTWNAGYDLTNMKARSWYEALMPVYPLDSHQATFVKSFVENAIAAAQDCISSLRRGIKTAWYKQEAKDVNGDFSFLDRDFYSKTERDFYRTLDTLVKRVGDDDTRSECAKVWEKIIKQKTLEIFDAWALSEQEDGLDMKRVISGRGELFRGFSRASKKLSVMQKEVMQNE